MAILILVPLILLFFGLQHWPGRARFWELIENWGADNKEAQQIRERRRELRRGVVK